MRPVTRALVLLALWQLKNAARASLRRPIVWLPLLLFFFFVPMQAGSALLFQSPVSEGTGSTFLSHVGVVRAVVFLTLVLLALGYFDRGLTGGAFTFDPADVAFLFSAPIPRRLLLLFKLPGVTVSLLGMVTMLAWQFRLFVWLPAHAQGLARPGGGWAALGAAALCIGGYLNAAMALDVAGSGRKMEPVRRMFLSVCVLAVAAGGWLIWTQRIAGLLAIDGSRLLNLLFFPCALAADAATWPLSGHFLAFPAWLALWAWYGATLALLLTRRENFYEAAAVHSENAARIRQAFRAGDWAAARAVKTGASNRRSLSVRGFGGGAGALWAAHLAAALKRPWLNVGGPALAGVAVTIALAVVMPRVTGDGRSDTSESSLSGIRTLLNTVAGYYVFYAVTTLAIPFYRRTLARETFGRTLPLPLTHVIMADVGVRSLLGCLFLVAQGVTLFFTGVPALYWTGLAYLTIGPVGVVLLNILSYRLALAYPNGADRAQNVVSSLVQTFWIGVLAVFVAPFYFAPVALNAPDGVILLSVVLGLCLLSALLLWMTVGAARRFEPAEDRPPMNARLWWADFRKGLSSPFMKKIVRPIVIIVIVLAVLAGVGARLNKKKPPVPPRTVAARTDTLIVHVSETGTIQPVDKINVQSKVSGRLLLIPVTEGQRVTAGQLIATVDRSQLDPQIAGQRALLTQAQARLQETIAQDRLQRAQTEGSIQSARANLAQAQAHLVAVSAPARTQDVQQQRQAVSRSHIALDDAVRTQKRRSSLLGRGFVSQSDMDAAQVAVDTAQSNLDAARASLSLTQAGPRTQDIADAQAAVAVARAALANAIAGREQYPVSQATTEQARASVAQAQTSLAQLLVQGGDTRILAPAPGIVLKKYKQPGEIVQSSLTGFSDAQSLVATLGSRLEVQVGINEVDIPKVRLDAPVTVRVDALPNVSFAGRVTEVSPASTNAFASTDGTSTTSISKFNVKVALAEYDARLRPGMTAQADIVSARHPKAILVPLEAVPFAGKTGTIQVLTGTTPMKRTVTVGLKSDTDAEIVKGLKTGDKVIVPTLSGKDRPKFDVGGG